MCGRKCVSPPFLHGKSRMRKRACTDLRGGDQGRKTLGGKSSRAEIKGVNVSSALPDVERFS
jgi:hypothetical protein